MTLTDDKLVAAFDQTMAALKAVGLVLVVGVIAAFYLAVALVIAVDTGVLSGLFFLVVLGVCIALTLEGGQPVSVRARNASRRLLPRWARSPRRTSVPRPAPRG